MEKIKGFQNLLKTDRLDSSVTLISHEIRDLQEKRVKKLPCRGRHAGFLHRCGHQLQPAIALGDADFKRDMAHPEFWMASCFHVAGRRAQAEKQEFRQSVFRAFPVRGGIHRANEVVGPHPPVKGRHHPADAVFPAGFHNFGFVHVTKLFLDYEQIGKWIPVFSVRANREYAVSSGFTKNLRSLDNKSFINLEKVIPQTDSSRAIV
jgi:hypothetical protein